MRKMFVLATLSSLLMFCGAGQQALAQNPVVPQLPVCGSATATPARSVSGIANNIPLIITVNLKIPEGVASGQTGGLSHEAISAAISDFKASLQPAADKIASEAASKAQPQGSEAVAVLQLRYEFQDVPAVQVEANPRGIAVLSELHSKIRCIQFARAIPLALWQSVPEVDASALGPDRGNGRMVAVLDTGIDGNHPFFQNQTRIAKQYAGCFRRDNGCPNGQSQQTGIDAAQSRAFHGTHVAGIVAGANGQDQERVLSGVASGSQVIPINIFSGDNSWTDDQEKALQYVLHLRKDLNLPISAINMSLSGGVYTSTCDQDDAVETELFRQLSKLNVAPVVAAGNDGYYNAVGFPACISYAVAVSAVDKLDNLYTGFDRSKLTKLLAPGVNILSSSPGGSYAFASGTSMAAPHVAGAFADISSRVPNASYESIVEALQNTGTAVRDPDTGAIYRRIDVAKAIDFLRSRPAAVEASKIAEAASTDQAPARVAGSAVISSNGIQIATFVRELGQTASAGGSSGMEYSPGTSCLLDIGFFETSDRQVVIPCSSLRATPDGRQLVSKLSQTTLFELSRVQSGP